MWCGITSSSAAAGRGGRLRQPRPLGVALLAAAAPRAAALLLLVRVAVVVHQALHSHTLILKRSHLCNTKQAQEFAKARL